MRCLGAFSHAVPVFVSYPRAALFAISSSLRHRPYAGPRRVASLRMSSPSSSPSPPADGSNSTVAQRIATAFIAACSPSSTPYAEQLANFCNEAISAYRSGHSLVSVQLEMSSVSSGGSLGRSLASDEVELRSVWLSLVYKTLRQLRFPIDHGAESSPSDGFDRDRLDEFVKNIVSAARSGYDMKRIKLEQALTSSTSPGDGGKNTSPRTPLEDAILNQSTRIVLTCYQLASDQMSG
jgi:hypothetical protein